MQTRKLISAAEAANRLGVPLNTISNHCRKGTGGIEGEKIGRNWAVYEDSLKNYVPGKVGKPKKSEDKPMTTLDNLIRTEQTAKNEADRLWAQLQKHTTPDLKKAFERAEYAYKEVKRERIDVEFNAELLVSPLTVRNLPAGEPLFFFVNESGKHEVLTEAEAKTFFRSNRAVTVYDTHVEAQIITLYAWTHASSRALVGNQLGYLNTDAKAGDFDQEEIVVGHAFQAVIVPEGFNIPAKFIVNRNGINYTDIDVWFRHVEYVEPQMAYGS